MEPVAPPAGGVEGSASPGHEVFRAAQLDTPTRSRIAVTQELSSTGARLLSIGRFKPGEVVQVLMLVAGDHSKVRATGKVVQAQPFSVGGPWRCQLRVEFDEPLDAEEEERLLAEP